MSNPYQPPPSGANYQPPGHQQGDATGGLIPYKNPYALISYYTGFASMLCCFAGLPVGIVAIVLGIMGLRKRAENPAISGTVHAWVGIVLGTMGTLGSIPFAIAIIGGIVGAWR